MVTYCFNPDSQDQPSFSSKRSGGHHDHGQAYELSGSCSRDEDGAIKVQFQVAYKGGQGKVGNTLFYIGRLDEQGSLMCFQGWTNDVSESNYKNLVIFRQVAPEIMSCRPSPAELKASKYRALWAFAIKFSLLEVRRKRWSWLYFAERRKIRKRYIELNIRHWTYGRPLSDEECAEFFACRKALSPSEAALYRIIRDHALAIMPKHQ